ncbi:MAG TPA: YHS domain-containing protein [Thermoplasmata archaeon]|nr:YHS domain-containing protein [Thermoplasmata archaeon]
MEKDPVCGMMVDPNRAAGGHSAYGGKTYHFCSAGCKASFDRNPAKFAK